MNRKNVVVGHLMALFSSFVWGITFISSRIVLDFYSPLALMVIRFALAYLALWIFAPKWLPFRDIKQELLFAFAGVTGVTGYFFMENTALLYTTVSNVGLILAAVPLLVALVLHFSGDAERFHKNFLFGFLIAMSGIALVIYNGQINLEVNPLGDVLALSAGVVWAFYSLAIKKIDQSISPLIVTRRVFFYGNIASIICLFIFEGGTDLSFIFIGNNLFHILFLGLLGSAACYVFWSKSIYLIGAIKTSSYIYLMPLFTMIASVLVLHEKLNGLMLIGCVLILLGVYISEHGFSIKKNPAKKNNF